MTSLIIKPPLIAHRGASAYAPENTLAAFAKAKELGASWVEFDVLAAADGELILLHDDSLERTTDGHGAVDAYPYKYLKTLDAGSWFAAEFRGERIPTLVQTIQFLAVEKLTANIEIKPLPGKEREIVEQVLAIVAQHWPSESAAPLLSSFSLTVLQELRRQSETVLLGFLMHEWQADWREVAQALRADSINVNGEILTAARVEELREFGKPVLVYTVNDLERAEELYRWGVTAVFTDCPDVILGGGF